MGKELPTRSEDYSLWYNKLVEKADLAEHSDVRGCMIIKPYGYSIWEKMQAQGSGGTFVLLSTHPSDEQRINDIKSHLPKAMEYYNQ